MAFTKKNNKEDIIDLNRNSLHTITNGRTEKKITCITGTLWITETNDQVDKILSRGDVYRTTTSGQVVIQALENARIETATTASNRSRFFNNSSDRSQPQLACA